MANRAAYLVHGSYFSRNFGDTLLVELMARKTLALAPGAEIRLPMVNAVAMQDFNDFGVGAAGTAPRALLYAGGGYLGEPPGTSVRWLVNCLRRHCALAEWARYKRIPYGLFGVGVGPLSNFILRRAVRRLVSGAQSVTVRDEQSMLALNEIGCDTSHAIVTTDMAQDPEIYSWVESGRPPRAVWRLALHLPGERGQQIQRPLVRILSALLQQEKDMLLTFIADNPGAVETIPELVAQHPERCEIERYVGPGALISTLASVDAVLTTKLHVGIVSSFLGKSVISVPSHSKTPRYFAQIGQPDRCLSDNTSLHERLEEAVATYGTPGSIGITLPDTIRAASAENDKCISDFVRRSM